MEIKTIKTRLDNEGHFDAAVNSALAEGWALTRRDVLLPTAQPSGGTYMHIMLYAEMVKLDPPAEPETDDIDPVTAAQIVAQECNRVDSCADCDLHAICGNCAPHQWTRLEASE